VCRLTEVGDRYRRLEERLARAAERSGRARQEVTVVAVTKTVPVATILQAYRAGLRVFGENRVQEAQGKVPHLPTDVEWHLVGPLQTNKARPAIGLFRWLHTVDRLRLVERLIRLREEGAELPVTLVEVNIGREPQKAGVLPEELGDLLERMVDLGLVPRGLMAVPPKGDGPEDARPYFQELRRLRDVWRRAVPELTELSMGMSEDFEAAVEEGATIIRVGTYLFGARR
jgi:pyridoxal phosphate enzyme (YggS family)